MTKFTLGMALRLVFLSANVCAGEDTTRVLWDANTEEDMSKWGIINAKASMVQVPANPVGKALKFVSPACNKWPSISTTSNTIVGDWSNWESLRVEFYNPGEIAIPFIFSISHGTNRKGVTSIEALVPPGEFSFDFMLDPVPLLKKTKIPLNTASVKFISFFLDVPNRAHTVYIRRISLNGIREKLPNVTGLKAFDFGPKSSEVFQGFTRVSAGTRFTDAQGYGWRKSPGESVLGWKADSIARDQVGWQKSEYRLDSSPTYTFSVALPNGQYVLSYIASNPLPLRSYSLKAEGKALLDRKIDIESAYTAKNMYRLMNIFYRVGQDAFTEYVERLAPQKEMVIDVTDGELTLETQNTGIHMLVVAPIQQKKELRRFMKLVNRKRRREFTGRYYKELQAISRFKDFSPDENDKKKGFATFTRHYMEEVYPTTIPGANEVNSGVEITAAKGETEPAVVGVYPLKNIKQVTLTVSDLKGPDNAIVSKDNVTVRRIRYFPKRIMPGSISYTIVPLILWPDSTAFADKGFTRAFWLTTTVSEDTPSGKYTGELKLRSATGGETVLPFKLNVRSFALPKKTSVAYSWYYRSPFWRHEGHRLVWFGAKADSRIREVIEEEFKDQQSHGFNATQLPETGISSVSKDGKVAIDFKELDLFIDVMHKTGFGLQHDNLYWTLHAADHLVKRHGMKEFSPEFNVAFKNYLIQMRDYLKGRKIPALFWLVDEPRERGLHTCNRNFQGTRKYIELAKQVPGIRLTVTVMSDQRDGADYRPLAPMLDTLQTFPLAESKGLRQAASASANTTLWLFNSGKNVTRFSFGFFPWRSKAKGRIQWHYNYEDTAYNPLVGISGFRMGVQSVVFHSPSGPVSTTWYEWSREGVDDMRYIELAESLIDKLQKSGGAKAAAAAVAAKNELENIRRQIPDSIPLDQATGINGFAYRGDLLTKPEKWRNRIASVIERLLAVK